VLTNGYAGDRKHVETDQELRLRKKLEKWVIKHKTYGSEIKKSVLGEYYNRPSYASRVLTEPKIDMSTTPEVSGGRVKSANCNYAKREVLLFHGIKNLWLS
jgi:hypothetical protein